MNNERYLRVHHDEQEHEREAESKSLQPLVQSSFDQSRMSMHKNSNIEDDDMTNPTSNLPGSGYASPATGYLSPMINSPATSLHGGGSGSFDLDDFDQDETLKRYKLDFTEHSNERRVSIEDSLTRGKFSFSAIWHAFLVVQMETRRKRLEHLLSVSSTSEKLKIKLASWCDIYDQGLTVLLITTFLWVTLCLVLHKTFLLVLGLLFLLVRISAKPAYWYCFGRHINRKRKATMDIYDELNQIATNTESTQDEEEERSNTPSLEIT